jgi:hypothetical protein
MTFKLFTLLTVTLWLIQACTNKQPKEMTQSITEPYVKSISKPAASIYAYNKTKGYSENGQIITDFDCPDSRFFPPIDIKSWNKTPVVNGRFPTYEETMNGTSIHHYGEKENPNVKPYNMTLPKLAYINGPTKKYVLGSKIYDRVMQTEVVVVIQIIQTATDTIVGYRYLTGGCGGSKFYKLRFLTGEEVKREVEKSYLKKKHERC